MRHGRKSKSKPVNGFKRHIAADLDTNLILACALTPADRPEEEATPELHTDLERQSVAIGELYIDRGYINSSLVDELLAARADVVCEPWAARTTTGKAFTQADFKFNFERSR